MSLFFPEPTAGALRLLSSGDAHLYAAVPLRKQGEMLTLATAGEMEEDLRNSLGEITGCFVKIEPAALDEVAAALARHYPNPRPEELTRLQSPTSATESQGARYEAPLPPVARLCRRLIILATDPFVASVVLAPRECDAMLRIVNHDGTRSQERLLTSFLAQQSVRQMKIFTNLETTTTGAQRGTLAIDGLKRPFSLVVETFAGDAHECVLVEILD